MESDDDLKAWQEAIQDVKPLPEKRVEQAPAPAKIKLKENKFETVALKPYKHEVRLNATADIDRKTFERLKKGKILPQATLDLHYQTEKQAFEKVRNFITQSYLQNKRCVLIITGKGLHAADEFTPRACLKTRVPQWLSQEELQPLILTYVHPTERFGGSGALMILLRRRRA